MNEAQVISAAKRHGVGRKSGPREVMALLGSLHGRAKQLQSKGDGRSDVPWNKVYRLSDFYDLGKGIRDALAQMQTLRKDSRAESYAEAYRYTTMASRGLMKRMRRLQTRGDRIDADDAAFMFADIVRLLEDAIDRVRRSQTRR